MKKCAENEQIRVLLERVLEYGERITKERPFTEYEKQGRLLSMFGVVCTTALEMYRMEMESKKTLLSPISCDYVRMIARLFDLRQPAPGADADLFTCRAAKELVELLNPAITDRVDFDYSYQFAAWVKAMMDLNLIYSNKDENNKRNGTLIVNYVFKAFRERIDKSTLFSYINKEKEFEKIKEQYELIMNICDSASGERIDFLKKAL